MSSLFAREITENSNTERELSASSRRRDSALDKSSLLAPEVDRLIESD